MEIYIVNGVVVENHSATLDGSNDLAMVGSQARNGVGRPPGYQIEEQNKICNLVRARTYRNRLETYLF